jgi:hypothetical protein
LLDQLAEVHGLDCSTVHLPLLLLVWLVLPLTALGAALPVVPLSRIETIYLLSGAGALVLMGLNCVVLAFATSERKLIPRSGQGQVVRSPPSNDTQPDNLHGSHPPMRENAVSRRAQIAPPA